jgi:hypothetical protein
MISSLRKIEFTTIPTQEDDGLISIKDNWVIVG